MERTTLEEYARKKGLNGPVPDMTEDIKIVRLNRNRKRRRYVEIYPVIKK